MNATSPCPPGNPPKTQRLGPWMLALGIGVHLLFPTSLLFLAFWLDRWTGKSLDWPLWVRLGLGGLFLALSIALEISSVTAFLRSGGLPAPTQHTRSLVVTGPYRRCRNPIFLAYLGYVIGLGIMLGLWSVFLVTAGYWLCLAAEARFVEEPRLRRRFGQTFERYRRSTPFMIPRLRR